MNRDKKSTQGGYSTRSYLKIIKYSLPAIRGLGVMFIHNNALIHTA